MSLLPSFLGILAGIGIVGGGFTVVVRFALGREVGEKFAGFGAYAVHARSPDFDATIQRTGCALKVDGIVGVIAEKRHVMKVVY
jgi:hypothetical protein